MPSALVRKGAAPLLTLTLLLGAGYLQALALTRLVAPALLPSAKGMSAALSGGKAATASPPEPTESVHQSSAAQLLERNPFDSTRGSLLPLSAPSAPSAAEATAPPGDLYRAPACSGVNVLATAAGSDASRSFALLGSARDGASAGVVRRQGDEYEGKQVWLVSWDRVWLRGPNSFCQAAMFSTAPTASPAAPTKPVAPAAKAAIRQREPGSYEVDRSFVDGMLEKQADFLHSVRAKPESVDGKIVGLRIVSVRPESPLAALGVAPGDLLESINGFHLGSPTEMLDAYAKLRLADRLRVAVTRQGRPMTLEYDVK